MSASLTDLKVHELITFISAILFEGGILLGATTDSSGFTGSTEQSWPIMQLERTVSQHIAAVQLYRYFYRTFTTRWLMDTQSLLEKDEISKKVPQ